MLTYERDGLAALADPTRRRIFERVVERPRAVCELAEGLPVSRPAVSQHLRVLKDARLVVDHPAGNRRIYAVDPAGLDELRVYFEQFWRRALVSFKTVVERAQKEGQ